MPDQAFTPLPLHVFPVPTLAVLGELEKTELFYLASKLAQQSLALLQQIIPLGPKKHFSHRLPL